MSPAVNPHRGSELHVSIDEQMTAGRSVATHYLRAGDLLISHRITCRRSPFV